MHDFVKLCRAIHFYFALATSRIADLMLAVLLLFPYDHLTNAQLCIQSNIWMSCVLRRTKLGRRVVDVFCVLCYGSMLAFSSFFSPRLAASWQDGLSVSRIEGAATLDGYFMPLLRRFGYAFPYLSRPQFEIAWGDWAFALISCCLTFFRLFRQDERCLFSRKSLAETCRKRVPTIF